MRAFRDERGWTQSALARRCGRDHHWLHRVESGKQALKVDEIPLVAAALGMDPGAFLYGPLPVPTEGEAA